MDKSIANLANYTDCSPVSLLKRVKTLCIDVSSNNKGRPAGDGKGTKADNNTSGVAGKTVSVNKQHNTNKPSASKHDSSDSEKLDAIMKKLTSIDVKVERNKKLINKQQQELDNVVSSRDSEHHALALPQAANGSDPGNGRVHTDHTTVSTEEYEYDYDEQNDGYDYYQYDAYQDYEYEGGVQNVDCEDYEYEHPPPKRSRLDLAAKAKQICQTAFGDADAKTSEAAAKTKNKDTSKTTDIHDSDHDTVKNTSKFTEALNKFKYTKDQKTGKKKWTKALRTWLMAYLKKAWTETSLKNWSSLLKDQRTVNL